MFKRNVSILVNNNVDAVKTQEFLMEEGYMLLSEKPITFNKEDFPIVFTVCNKRNIIIHQRVTLECDSKGVTLEAIIGLLNFLKEDM